jgi:SAM-dependent methyltransferase
MFRKADGFRWSRKIVKPSGVFKRVIRRVPYLRAALRFVLYQIIGHRDEQWLRVVMNCETTKIIATLQPEHLNTLEISGAHWQGKFQFKSYRVLSYPEYDVCQDTLPERFDLIIAEQVFEHLLYPYRAARNIYEMLKPGGYFLITTPFLVKVHNYPVDCTRWTETGIKYFLAECGFSPERIHTSSWGNRACVVANFADWRYYNRWLHPLKNEPDFPLTVWALAQKND